MKKWKKILPTVKKIRTVALDFLARREYSRLELQNKLAHKGFERAQIDATLDTLTAENLLNEHRFCEAFVRSKIARGYGLLRIKEELRQRGVPEDLAQQYLKQQENTWVENIAEIRRKRFGNTIPSDFKERAKQMRFLQYRGFTIEQIKTVFDE